jgi:hypothetical protein
MFADMKKTASLAAFLAACAFAGAALGARKVPARKKPSRVTVSASASATTTTSGPERDSIQRKPQPLDAGNAIIIAAIGPEVGMRSFTYNQAIVGGLRSYTSGAIPMGSVALEAYPFAASGTPILRDFGLVGRFGSSLSFKSSTRDGGQSANATWTRYAVGARARIHTSDGPGAVLVGIEGAYGDSKFTFTGTDTVVLAVPSVDYKYVRAGADVRVPLGQFALFGGAGYLNILSSGAFEQKFPRAKLGGLDARLGAGYRITRSLELLASGEYVRVFSSVNPQPGDPFVAGGGLDQYAVFHVGISLLF